MIFAALLLAVQTGAPNRSARDQTCLYDRKAMLALGEDAFDQDMTGGWRTLSDKGCTLVAADLIADYRAVHPRIRRTFLSFWHEGQLRAEAGQTRRAIALFSRARKTLAEDAGFGWNLYVDGSIAFLRHDRTALQSARDRLAALPKPDGVPATLRWPMNLNVLDGFLPCFGKDYRTAYGSTCNAPMTRISVP